MVKKHTKQDKMHHSRPSDNLADFFDYDPRLILRDLRKTLLVSVLILLVLLLAALIYT